ncbi:dienelactone hydrolase family protein [Microbacterium luticocti]|uniref:dienelactone hydrolase family protein n=1 Tax=Microbacterium luticocti TaxID=451764 RepID=UPI0003FD3DF4|nr:dienelactone hydrolase family protein [Microbacterium luticocti]
MSATLTLTAPDGEPFAAYLARPAGEVRGGLIVIHEIWGLTDHIRAVADRFAAEGYVVIAPDILSHGGIAPALGAELFAVMNSADESARTAAQPRMREALAGTRAPAYARWATGALQAAVDRLETEPGVDERIGVVGFCFGGTYAFLLATVDDRLRAVVPFYGTAPDAEAIARIQAPVLALYGAHDPALMEALPQVRADMAAAGVEFDDVVYAEASHAFFNDTGTRYDADAAADAWERVLQFLATRL